MTDAPTPRCSSDTTNAFFDRLDDFARETAPYGYVGANKAIAQFLAKAREHLSGGVAQRPPVDPACSGCAGITHTHTCNDPSKGPQLDLMAPAQQPTKPGLDDRPIPTYGQIPWDQLGRDVMDAMYAKRSDYPFDKSYYPGHQMVPQINFNSLARIVDKYRYYGASSVPSTQSKTGED